MCRHSQTDIFANFTAQNETLVKAYMVYRFTIISDEVEDFMREIQIDSEATFFDLHIAILKSVKYPDDQMTAFFLCSDKWERETEVALEDIGTSSDEDCWVMSETKLDELLEDEKQRLVYVFDPLGNRMFFMELRVKTESFLSPVPCRPTTRPYPINWLSRTPEKVAISLIRTAWAGTAKAMMTTAATAAHQRRHRGPCITLDVRIMTHSPCRDSGTESLAKNVPYVNMLK